MPWSSQGSTLNCPQLPNIAAAQLAACCARASTWRDEKLTEPEQLFYNMVFFIFTCSSRSQMGQLAVVTSSSSSGPQHLAACSSSSCNYHFSQILISECYHLLGEGYWAQRTDGAWGSWSGRWAWDILRFAWGVLLLLGCLLYNFFTCWRVWACNFESIFSIYECLKIGGKAHVIHPDDKRK